MKKASDILNEGFHFVPLKEDKTQEDVKEAEQMVTDAFQPLIKLLQKAVDEADERVLVAVGGCCAELTSTADHDIQMKKQAMAEKEDATQQ